MSETSQQQPPDEQANAPGPRPGVRIRPPGAAPALPAAESEPEATNAPTPQPAPVTPPEPTSPARPQKPANPRKVEGAKRSPASEQRSATSPTTTSSTTGSTDPDVPRPPDPPAPAFVEPDELIDAVSDSLVALSENANERFTPGSPLLIADDEEARGVASPAVKILVRHLPAGMAGGGNPDLADAIAAGIVIFRYALRQSRLWIEVRRARKAGPPPGTDAATPPGADPLAPAA